MTRQFPISDWKYLNWPTTDWPIYLVRPCGLSGFGLRSVSGESGAEGGEERLANRSRSATPAAEPQTEARRSCGTLRMPARDERAVCEAERASSRGGKGRPKARRVKQTARWSRWRQQTAVSQDGGFEDLVAIRSRV